MWKRQLLYSLSPPERPHPLSLIKSRIRLLIIEERKKRALFEEIQNLRRYYNVVLEEV